MTLEIFLSHNSRDRGWTEHVAAHAAALGIKPYLAEHDVRAGHFLAEKVQAAIRRSAAVVVLISDNSVNAPYVQQEIGFALAMNKVVIPLVQPGVSGEMLAMLQGVEYIPFDFDDPEQGLAGLNVTLKRLVERQQHDRRKQRDQDEAVLVIGIAALVLIVLYYGN